jgi:hypothetical protein
MTRTASPCDDRSADGCFRRTRRDDPGGVRLAAPPPAQPAERRVKRTYYLTQEAVLALEVLRLEDRFRTGVRPDLSDLVTEAIWLLVKSRRGPVSGS